MRRWDSINQLVAYIFKTFTQYWKIITIEQYPMRTLASFPCRRIRLHLRALPYAPLRPQETPLDSPSLKELRLSRIFHLSVLAQRHQHASPVSAWRRKRTISSVKTCLCFTVSVRSPKWSSIGCSAHSPRVWPPAGGRVVVVVVLCIRFCFLHPSFNY